MSGRPASHTEKEERGEGPTIPFPFPYPKPYPAQEQLMNRVFDTIRRGGGSVGVFESPTGTGKSLSLITASLHWLFDQRLRDERERLRRESEHAEARAKERASASSEPSWVDDYFRQKAADDAEHDLQAEEGEMERRRASKRAAAATAAAQRNAKRSRQADRGGAAGKQEDADDERGGGADDDVEFLVDWHDESDGKRGDDAAGDAGAARRQRWEAKLQRALARGGKLSDDDEEDVAAERRAVQACRERAARANPNGAPVKARGGKGGAEGNDDDDDSVWTPKIIYTSRTHSQLSQFVNEVKRTSFADLVECVSLGSRKNLCVNEDVRKLESAERINDRCLDLADERSKSKSGSKKKRAGCPYLEEESQQAYRRSALESLRDLEELHSLGRELGACAYYGTRRAVGAAQLVVLPYPSLLHGPTRESLGVSLRDSVVIIDEAHNLVESINQAYSSRLSARIARAAHSQLSQYLERYMDRLRDSNRNMIERLLRLLRRFLDVLSPEWGRAAPSSSSSSSSSSTRPQAQAPDREMLQVNEFVFAIGQDHVNPFPLRRFIEESDLIKKLNGFTEHFEAAEGGLRGADGPVTAHGSDGAQQQQQQEQQQQQQNDVGKHVSALGQVDAFLEAISNSNRDGRILIDRGAGVDEDGPAGEAPPPAGSQRQPRRNAFLQFVMLNPAVHFQEVVSEARAVVLAGGTMQPFDLVVQQLFGSLPRDRLTTFTCGHVVPKENVLAVTFGSGPGGGPLEFTFGTRGDLARLDELGMAVVNLCRVVPEGVVLFFPSYSYEKEAMDRWSLPRDGHGPSFLAQIGRHKRVFRESRSGGAVAMEGTLREYTRHIAEGGGAMLTCVVGGKMSEGINFSDGLARCVAMVGLPFANRRDPELAEKMAYLDKTVPRVPGRPSPGEQHYHGLCMRAVNQSIGRAIRHYGDFAAIALLDRRYSGESVAGSLPGWIRERLVHAKSFGEGVGQVAQFFAFHRRRLQADKGPPG